MRKGFLVVIIAAFQVLLVSPAQAEEPIQHLRLKTDFNIWKVNLEKVDWMTEDADLYWNGFKISLPADLSTDQESQLNRYLKFDERSTVDPEKVRAYLDKVVTPAIYREKEDVTIDLNEKGQVVFDGFAISGQEVDFEKAVLLIDQAIKRNEPEVRVPLKVIEPIVTVKSDKLREKGITSLLSTGETDFSGSSWSRIHNVKLGLSRFDGEIIGPGEESGAYAMIGYVGPESGYREELVIKGAHTVPEYGGGLCQVSTTVYRSLLFAGLPITARRNHSYAVGYYDPQGLDATIYFPETDMKFVNDTPAHILLQTTTKGYKAYANVYGTQPDRTVDLIGPYYYNHVAAPPAKVKYTETLSPGEKQVVSGVHPGFESSWYRRISYSDEAQTDVVEHIHSNYSSRGLITLIGKEAETPAEGASDNGT